MGSAQPMPTPSSDMFRDREGGGFFVPSKCSQAGECVAGGQLHLQTLPTYEIMNILYHMITLYLHTAGSFQHSKMQTGQSSSILTPHPEVP